MTADERLAVVIMAAGKGTRMKNPNKAKVMYTVAGKPMVEHVVDLASRLHSSRTMVIVGWQKQSIIEHLARTHPGVLCVEQNPQLGTAHAVMQAGPALQGYDGDLIVLSGDVPLLSYGTMAGMIEFHRRGKGVATVLTAVLPDPTGYGRIIRDGSGQVIAIVEQKDATPSQRDVKEINSGIYVFRSLRLFEALQHVTPENAQKEYYLTDVFGYFWRNKLPVLAVPTIDPREVQGVNTLAQLEEIRSVMESR